MLKKRIISGLSMGAVVIGVVFVFPLGLVMAITLAVCLYAQVEFYQLLKTAGIKARTLPGCAGACVLVLYTFWTHTSGAAGASPLFAESGGMLAFVLLVLFIRELFDPETDQRLETLGGTVLGVCYVGFLFTFLIRLGLAGHGGGFGEPLNLAGQQSLFYVILIIKMSDIGAYFAGSRFGKHKLVPRLSPGKTWEGLAGGYILAVANSIIFLHFTGGSIGGLQAGLGHAVFLPLLLTTAGVAGDLFESLVKRSSDRKDSGEGIPGMGGILDVLDSLLFGTPVMYIYSCLFLV